MTEEFLQQKRDYSGIHSGVTTEYLCLPVGGACHSIDTLPVTHSTHAKQSQTTYLELIHLLSMLRRSKLTIIDHPIKIFLFKEMSF